MPVNGALIELTREWNWEQSDGGITPEAAAAEYALLFDQFSRDNCMIGVIFVYASSQAPSGSLACDGATYNRSDYPDLYDNLDAAYRIGSTQFFTPDLRGRCVIGDGTGAGLTNRPFAVALGTETHQLTIAQMPTHSHAYTAPAPVLNPLVTGPVPNASAGAVAAFVGTNGGGGAHNNMQPSLPLHYAIWAK